MRNIGRFELGQQCRTPAKDRLVRRRAVDSQQGVLCQDGFAEQVAEVQVQVLCHGLSLKTMKPWPQHLVVAFHSQGVLANRLQLDGRLPPFGSDRGLL